MTNYVVRHGRRIEIRNLELGVVPGDQLRRRRPDPFVKVPLKWAAAATKATKTPQTLVWVLLLHEAWRTKGSAFSLSNAKLAKYGISREVKRRALAALETAGLITVDRHHGRAPVVTLL